MIGPGAGSLAMVVVAASFLMGAGPVLMLDRVSGTVTDAETKRPIEGAVVRLETKVECPTLHGHYDHERPPRETRTDKYGKFSLGDGLGAECFPFPVWRSLRIVAPGYLSHTVEHLTSSSAGTLSLEPIRYRAELEGYARLAKERPGEPASHWAFALEAGQRLLVQPAGPRGVFASQPGAVFDRVATIERPELPGLRRWMVVAQDRNTGALYGWTAKGTAEPVPALPAGARLLTQRHRQNDLHGFFEQPGEVYLRAGNHMRSPAPLSATSMRAPRGVVRLLTPASRWIMTVQSQGRDIDLYDLDRWGVLQALARQPDEPLRLRPDERRPTSDVLPGAGGPVECMTTVDRERSATTIAFFVSSGRNRELFLLTPGAANTGTWTSQRVRIVNGAFDSEVTACAAGHEALYLAMKDGNLVKLTLEPRGREQGVQQFEARIMMRGMLEGPAGSLSVSGLVVGNVDPGLEVVYAVAGDEVVYRLGASGKVDQRVR